MARGQDGLHVEMTGGGTPPRSANGVQGAGVYKETEWYRQGRGRVYTDGSVTHEGDEYI